MRFFNFILASFMSEMILGLAIRNPTTHKGYVKPGPLPGPKADSLIPETGETLDSISGHFMIFQLKNGHRYSTDDVLVAW